MEEIHLDLRNDATRRYICNDLLNRLDSAVSERIIEIADTLDVSGGHCHDLLSIEEVVKRACLSEVVISDSHAIYRTLAEAEAHVHGCSIEETHFHEVGTLSHLRDVITICLAVEALSPSIITATPVQVGRGSIVCAHGTLDIPAPATVEILNQGVPIYSEKREGEWCTPTSASVILHFVDHFEF